ncbi:MAG: hypothetical protein Fur0037_28740 [Planctomycetota bacterium]
MHSRQSGAAHVPIMFFLILMVLFLGALGFAYVTITENSDLRARVDDLAAKVNVADAKIMLRDHYIADVGDMLKLTSAKGDYEGRASVDYSGQTLKDLSGVMSPALVREKLQAFSTAAEIVSYNGVENMLNAVIGKLDFYKNRVKELESARDQAIQEKAAVDAGFRKAQSEHASRQEALSNELNTTRTSLNAQVSNKDSLLAQTQANLNTTRDEKIAADEAHAQEVKKLKAEIAMLRAHNTALVSKIALINPPSVADGRIIAARPNVSQAFIDLGRKDMLQPGTIFRIKSPDSDKVKGYATVVRVEQERAEVSLSGIVDPVADQVREGDRIFNDLYTPNQSRNIFLLGRFDYPYHKPELEKLLTGLGNKVFPKMVPGVDLVILGDKTLNEAQDGLEEVTESPEYKLALGLGVEFAPLHKIRDLLKQ